MTQVSVQSNLESLINAHKENHLYAVVDGARDNQIHHNLVVCNANYYSLFFGEEAEDLEQVAPYLVKLKQGDLFTQWYLDHGFGNSMSILMSSSHTELELQDHLQSFAKPLMEFESDEGIKYQEVFLAFYDPRVFPNYLRSISMEHRVVFLQPFKAIFYESAKTVLNQLTLNATRNDVKSTLHDLSQAQSFAQIESEFPPEVEEEINQDFQPIIDIETNRKLLDYNFQIFIDGLLTNLLENSLIRTEEKSIKDTSLKGSSVKEARHYIQQQSREAQNRNITNEAAITYYVQAKLEYGVGFTDDPQYLHLTPILNNENISDINKADILFEAFEQYEKHVYGEENIYLNQAYKQALNINDDHLKKMSADVLLHFVYPEKFNYLKGNASSALEQLSHSANDYSKGKRWNNSFPIILLLMFLFGHQFYRDYRLQKLNEKTQELTKENAEPSAQQLIQLIQAGVADHG